MFFPTARPCARVVCSSDVAVSECMRVSKTFTCLLSGFLRILIDANAFIITRSTEWHSAYDNDPRVKFAIFINSLHTYTWHRIKLGVYSGMESVQIRETPLLMLISLLPLCVAASSDRWPTLYSCEPLLCAIDKCQHRPLSVPSPCMPGLAAVL